MTRDSVRVGTVLTGYCRGFFGRDSYGNKRVEAVGADWVVARSEDGNPVFAACSPEALAKDSDDEPVCPCCMKLVSKHRRNSLGGIECV